MVDCGGNGNKGTRFACPSDRQLALLAKLKAGWSVKTGSLGGPVPPAAEPLSSTETDAILKVVQRAEEIEQQEAQRVGRLVERLESMRRMALGRNASECLLCGETFGLLSGGPRMVCADCRKTVCNKCGVETALRKANRDVWLCKICSETREMWKKSGAWFYRGLPRYVLPVTNASPRYNHGHQLQQHGQAGLAVLPRVAMATGSVGTRTMIAGAAAATTTDDAASSGSDEDRTRSVFFYKEQRSPQQPTTAVSSSASSNNYANYDNAYSRQASSSESQFSGITLQESTSSIRWSDECDKATALGGSSDGSSIYVRSDSYSLTRKDSVASKSDLTYSTTDDKISLSGSSVSNASNQQSDELNLVPTESAMGTIELTLYYDLYSNVLHCTVHRAKNLMPMDINHLADPFCKLNILPTNNPSTRLRTKTVHKTRNPEFNETVTFYGITENDIVRKSLHVLVLDDDKYGYDFMGEAKVPLTGLRGQNNSKVTTILGGQTLSGNNSPYGDSMGALWGDLPNTRGQILIALTYSTKRRALLVGIMRCVHLPPMDSNGFSDPFVKLYLYPDPHHKKHKTSIKWKTLNPTFNEEFAFETRPTDLSTQSLKLTVWDKDYGKSNDYLGGLILGGMSKGKRLKHWLDVIKFPDHRHEAWHFLTEDMVSE